MLILHKSLESELDQIEKLLSSMEKQYRQAFSEYISKIRSEEIAKEVRQVLEAGRIEQAIKIINSQSSIFLVPINLMMINAAADETARLQEKILPNPKLGVSFDPGNREAAETLKNVKETFIRELNESTRQAVYQILIDAQEAGEGPAQTAKRIKESIGLTAKQLQAVKNYRRLPEAGSKEAYRRELHDKRFKPKQKPLTQEQIDRMVARYSEKMLGFRAITIARTEAHTAMNEARAMAFRQMLENHNIPTSDAQKQWLSSKDPRVRDQHIVLDNGTQIPLDQPFIAPNGDRLMFPGDRSLGARASNIVNCRCQPIYSIKQGQ
jgi:hypothetical protein